MTKGLMTKGLVTKGLVTKGLVTKGWATEGWAGHGPDTMNTGDLRGDIDEARWAVVQPWISNPPLMAPREDTLNVGLRRTGMHDH
jgi:hypothetical protein